MDEWYLVDTKEFARMLNKSTSTIKRWKKEGRLPTPLAAFDKDYWTLGEVRRWLVQSGLFQSIPSETD